MKGCLKDLIVGLLVMLGVVAAGPLSALLYQLTGEMVCTCFSGGALILACIILGARYFWRV